MLYTDYTTAQNAILDGLEKLGESRGDLHAIAAAQSVLTQACADAGTVWMAATPEISLPDTAIPDLVTAAKAILDTEPAPDPVPPVEPEQPAAPAEEVQPDSSVIS